jgi:hypothetical protein
MNEPGFTQQADGGSSLPAAKKDLMTAWMEESWPEPEHGSAELFHYLWCAKTSSTSRHHSFKPIFMMQSAEDSLLS